MVTTRRGVSYGADTTAETNGTNGVHHTPAQGPPSRSKKAREAHHHTEYEFFGPHGPLLLIFVLPLTVYGLYYGCNKAGCLKLWPEFSVPGFPAGTAVFTWQALGVFLAWFFGVVALHLILPGRRVQGTVLPNGTRLTYKLNSFAILLITYLGAAYLSFMTPHLNLGWVYDNHLQLLTASVAFSSALAVYLYLSSFKSGALLSGHGSSGWWWYDFWMGRELNPRIGSFDLKEFCEMYPGLIGWAIINLGLAHKQYSTLGRVTNSVIIVNAFQLHYVVDALFCEESILTTMDITTDGFGYMLAFGDLSWVPFVFTTSTRYLVDTNYELSWAGVAVVLAVQLLGYWIFRSANEQKAAFRRNPNDPSVSHLQTLPTQRGTKLIISGWWGISRHINYLGDWIMGVAWCLPCGLAGLTSVIPYFYCIYFATLLIHRERRDDAACRVKYGKDWDTYCSIVKYRIIPFVY